MNNIINWTKAYKMDTSFHNSENSNHIYYCLPSDKKELKKRYKYFAFSTLNIYWYRLKNIEKIIQKEWIKNFSLNMEWLNWITWYITFCIRHSILFLVYHQEAWLTDNLSIRIYINRIKNRTTFEFKLGIISNFYHLKP